MPIDEISIEIRNDTISIQGSGVGDKREETIEILERALDALKSKDHKDTYTNEIVIATA